MGRFKTLDFLVRRLKVAPGAAGGQKMAGGGLAWAKEGKGEIGGVEEGEEVLGSLTARARGARLSSARARLGDGVWSK